MNEKNACVIGHITIRNPEQWELYRGQVPATLVPFGADILFRGKRARVMSGRHEHTDTVVISFPDLASAHAWFDSPAYQALLPLREQAAAVDLIAYEK